jgi:multimeric flavodoxin WrbA
MPKTVIGISGSPVQNSNTDRLIKHILEQSGLDTEFVKLSDIKVSPCRACKRCVEDNICKIPDDFSSCVEKVRETRARVLGAYIPYRMVDTFTKAFLERLWSMRHIRNLNKNNFLLPLFLIY